MIVGIVGGGQLARMMALAGHPLGLKFVFLDPAPDACAASLGEHLCGCYDDPALLARLAERADLVTYEFENVPPESIKYLSKHITVHPSHHTLAIARDRLREKTLFGKLGIPTPRFLAVNTRSDLESAIAEIGLPAVLKTRSLGYDGKGQVVLRSRDDLDAAWAQLGGMPLILEGFVPFDREISVIAVRGLSGETRFYPIAENTHRDGILLLSRSRPGDPMQQLAQNYARLLLDNLKYVGIFALELFQVGDMLLANEVAPRVHNSGHWTIEGAETSQFENHLRAILGLPLGSTTPVGQAAMVNFIGTMPETERALTMLGVHLHDYGKEPRLGRKLGHATLRAQDEPALRNCLDQLLALAQ
jgi:5-(carboxyamino)imidazole ribonucleotide synthase